MDADRGPASQQAPGSLPAASAAAAASAPAAPALAPAADGGAAQPSQADGRTGGESTSGGSGPKCFVVVYNVSKRHNIGTLLRSCTAFGVTQVCLVGSRQFNTFGSHGSSDFVDLRHFPTIEACCEWLRDEQGCRIVGVEIDDSAVPVQSHPFSGNTAFMLGNEGQGLSQKQMRLCDAFVYIPQHGAGTASLNVTIAASIVLHHFALWARYPERGREGAKFVVADKPQRTRPRGVVPLTLEEQAAAKAARAAAAAEGGDWMAEAMAGGGGLEGMMEALAAAQGEGGGGAASSDGSGGSGEL